MVCARGREGAMEKESEWWGTKNREGDRERQNEGATERASDRAKRVTESAGSEIHDSCHESWCL